MRWNRPDPDAFRVWLLFVAGLIGLAFLAGVFWGEWKLFGTMILGIAFLAFFWGIVFLIEKLFRR
jgi:fatty acid desaturase